MGSLDRPIGLRGETGRPLWSPAFLVIPGRVAPARSGLPPRGASDLGRSDVDCPRRSELLCGREFDFAEDGRPDDGLPLEEAPDADGNEGRPLEGLDDGREPLDDGRRESIFLNSIPSG